MEHMGGARGQALGAHGATRGWLRGCEVLLTSYPEGVVGPLAVAPLRPVIGFTLAIWLELDSMLQANRVDTNITSQLTG